MSASENGYWNGHCQLRQLGDIGRDPPGLVSVGQLLASVPAYRKGGFSLPLRTSDTLDNGPGES
jgi:hypothetical protein